ncbi:MAG: AI-2E family transporter [Geobacter sp.]|jgi:predicted PurR-regulated permease PerM|nr:AI-2E family transporter [Geobacter sp.]
MLQQRLKIFFFLLLGLATIGYILSLGHHTVSNFLLAGTIAYLVVPLVRFLEDRKIPAFAAVSLVFVMLLIVSWAMFELAAFFLLARFNALITSAPEYFAKLQQTIQGIQAYLVNAGLPKESVAGLSDLPLPTNIGLQLVSKANALGTGLFHLVIIPIVLFLMLYYRSSIKESAIMLAPEQYRSEIIQIGREIDRAMRQFLFGQAIIVAVVWLFTYPALLLIGVKYPLICALVAGVLTLIPYIGTFVSITLPLFLAYADGLGAGALVQIIFAYSLIHLVEGYIVKPLIYKRGVINLHPLATIFAVLFFGEVFGLWGIVLAIPAVAIAKIIWQHIPNISRQHNSTTMTSET